MARYVLFARHLAQGQRTVNVLQRALQTAAKELTSRVGLLTLATAASPRTNPVLADPPPILHSGLALDSGTRLGVYEVTAPIGAGGMGEVYRARDTKLNREVAIKVLPDAFAADPDRAGALPARSAAAGLGQSSATSPRSTALRNRGTGARPGARRGPTLSDRIARGPLPIEDALPIARQIAEALEAAHEKGDRPSRSQARRT